MPKDKCAMANEKKNEGNEAFRKNSLKTALALYNESLRIHPLTATYNNRAMVYIILEKYDEAIVDCHEVIKAEPGNEKAYYRRSLCYKSVGELRNALEDIQICLEIAPDSKQAKTLRGDIEGILLVNKNYRFNLSEEAPSSCECTVGSLKTTCVTDETKHFDFVDAYVEDNRCDKWRKTEDDLCAKCNTYRCVVWNSGSAKKYCLPSYYPILGLFKTCHQDLFPSDQCKHVYGFCNMELYYKDEYASASSSRNPSQVLLGLYQMLRIQIGLKAEGNCSQVMSSPSYPLSMRALHEACEKNSLDAFLQQYIDELISEGFKQHISGTYPDMWRKRKYIIGPTYIGANDTAQEVGDMRKKLYNYFYA